MKEDGIRKEGKGKENTSQKTYLSEKPPRNSQQLIMQEGMRLILLHSIQEPRPSSSLLFPQSTGPFEVEDGVAYAVEYIREE